MPKKLPDLTTTKEEEDFTYGSHFTKICRKKGFVETLMVLMTFKQAETKLSVFYQTLNKIKSHSNDYFRVKDALLENKLISFKLDGDNDKVIYLTDKGKKLSHYILVIEDILQQN